ncbi:hypothetical protein D5086_007673 [Populus alba]|uniref:Uncharacterized protein n=1 Tax=Populus alba TaxID=43335 RepID=A0ACC4CPH1_POPAL
MDYELSDSSGVCTLREWNYFSKRWQHKLAEKLFLTQDVKGVFMETYYSRHGWETDDDLPPTHRNRFQSGVQTAGNGRSAVVGGASQPSLHSDMETQIHNIEQEAYTSVLRAFKAQSDAITWDHARKQKTSQSVASLSMGAPSPVLHPSMQQSTSALRHGPPPGSANKKPKSSMQRCSTGLSGRAQVANHGSSGAFAANDLIGKKVWTQWPEDNHFYEAVITDYNAVEGRHALVYDINTGDETWEWVNLKEVEKVFGASHPDPLEIEKAKKVLREQEQALVKAIARLEDASDGESDEGEHPFPHIQSKDQNQNRGWRKQPCNEIAGEGRGIKGSGGNKMARNGRIVPSDHHDENYDM